MVIFESRTPRWIIILVDLFINLFALLFAYVIRFDLDRQSELIQEEWDKFSNWAEKGIEYQNILLEEFLR